MAYGSFDSPTREISRNQTSLAPIAERRKRKKSKSKNSGGRNIFARCTSQISACRAFAEDNCESNADCQAAVTACCELLGSCDFTAFIECFEEAI